MKGAIRSLVVLVVASASLAVPADALAKSTPLGTVGFIAGGLSVSSPSTGARRAKVHMPLFAADELKTGPGQRAALKFADGSLLRLNASTDVVLRNPHLSVVSRGIVNEVIQPGTDHRVQTVNAVAAALGTDFQVKVVPGSTYFAVVEGALLVKNPYGSVVVKSGQGTLVANGQAPGAPGPWDAKAATRWTAGLPQSTLARNFALDANGGRIAAASSVASSAYGASSFSAAYVIDGRLDRGWQSAGGVAGQWITIRLPTTVTLQAILIDPAATGGSPATMDLAGFDVRAGMTKASAAASAPVLVARTVQSSSLQRFSLGVGRDTRARFVRIDVLSNFGSRKAVAIAEVEVVGRPV